MLDRPKLSRFFLACALFALLAAASTTAPQADPTRYLNDVTVLASPEMEGRGAGTKGLQRAQHLIEKRYRELHLDDAGVNGYAQPFSVVTGARLKSDNLCSVLKGASRTDLKPEQDFVPFSFSSSGQATAPLVFVGYGASADEFQYDDYAGLDVKDKIVVLLRYEPSGFAAKSGNNGLTHHSQLVTKAINARNHGAKAVVVLNGKLGDGEEDVLTRFGSVSGPENAGIIFVQVKNAAAESWFQAAGKSLKDVQEQINSSTKPASFAFPDSLQLSLHIDIETTRARVSNVLAWLPGQSDDYVIIGAHYDHLGRGNFDSLAPSQIGRIKDDKVYIGGVGTGSNFKSVLEQAQKDAPFQIEYSAGGYSSSDHTSFVGKKIPVLFFFSGLHSDYHKPSDTADKINAPSAARLLDMVESVAAQLADAPEPPAFQVVAEENPPSGGGGGGYGPYFGSIPDFGQTENGVKFSDVKPNSPAAKAGLKAGDILAQFGDKPIKNLYDFTDALRRSKVGDVVEVKVLRDGQPVTASVKLEQRK